MEPQTPVVPTPLPQPKKNNLVVILLSVFLLITLLISGYLLLQVQSLTKQLAQIQIQPTPTPLSTEIPSPTPDLTANWKTYKNTKVGFELKYPQRYSQPGLPSGLGPTIYATGDEDNTDIIFGESSMDSIDLVVFPFTGTTDELKNYTKSPILLPSDEKATLIKTLQVGGVTANWYRYDFIRIYFVGKNHGFILNTLTDHNEGEIDQILSTFKFTN